MAIEATNESAQEQAILNTAIARGCWKSALSHQTHKNVAVATSVIFITKYFKIRSATTLTLGLLLAVAKVYYQCCKDRSKFYECEKLWLNRGYLKPPWKLIFATYLQKYYFRVEFND